MTLMSENNPDYGETSLDEMSQIRTSDASWLQWRQDSSLCEEYYDGNPFSGDDMAAAEANGIALTSANYIAPTVNGIGGIQESALTSYKVTGEDPQHKDAYDAMGTRLQQHIRMTDADVKRIDAYASQICAGIGWLEVGRETNPLLGKYYVDNPPWKEMFFDLRSRGAGLYNSGWLRRIKNYNKHELFHRFADIPDARGQIEAGPRPSQSPWMTIEPDQNYRAYSLKRPRDFALLYQNTPMDEHMRALEEVWKPVHLEGLFLELPNGRVMLYDERNSMHKMIATYGIGKLIEGPYVHWRRSLWCGDFKLDDCWSPLPWLGHPYIAFFCYREGLTNVPYGVVRGLLSLQDEINSATAKFHFGLDAVRIVLEEQALSDTMTIEMVLEQAAQKRGAFIMKPGKINAIRFDQHAQLNEQNYKRAQDAKQDIRACSSVAGLNPVDPQSGPAANASMLRALASLGKPAKNYKEASILLGERLLELDRADIASQGDVGVTIRHPVTKSERRVVLHEQVAIHEMHGPIVNNDVTLLKAEVVLEEVPHTATYRAQQLQDLMKLAQSLPDVPEAVKARIALTSAIVSLSDIPNGAVLGQQMLEQAGLAPPSSPEMKAQVDQQQQDAQQQKQITVETALAQIGHRKAQSAKLLADADFKKAQAAAAAAEVSDPQYEQTNKQLLLQRTETQNRRTAAQAAKIEKELAQPPEPIGQPPELPQEAPPNW
jgi:hypothetical protein